MSAFTKIGNKMDKSFISPELENDAVFLPATQRNNDKSIHGCDDELYILYYNSDANCRNGCFEIQITNREILTKIFTTVKNDYIQFFTQLQIYCENMYIDRNSANFEEFYSIYNSADFIVSRDGTIKDEFHFIKEWALNP